MTTAPRWRWKKLAEQYGIAISRETLRQWLIAAKLWRARRARVEQAHVWRARRARYGELVQWDTSEHDWLEGRGEKLYLIPSIGRQVGRESNPDALSVRRWKSRSASKNASLMARRDDAIVGVWEKVFEKFAF